MISQFKLKTWQPLAREIILHFSPNKKHPEILSLGMLHVSELFSYGTRKEPNKIRQMRIKINNRRKINEKWPKIYTKGMNIRKKKKERK
jgi:hypothetical protein